jgi:hypothetical protein
MEIPILMAQIGNRVSAVPVSSGPQGGIIARVYVASEGSA